MPKVTHLERGNSRVRIGSDQLQRSVSVTSVRVSTDDGEEGQTQQDTL